MAGDEASVEAEYIRWQQLWRQTDLSKRPKTVVGALQSANEFGTYYYCGYIEYSSLDNGWITHKNT